MTLLTRHTVTDHDREYAAEFRLSPVGHHSPGLRRLLNRFRGEPVEGKYVLLVIEPHREWMLARLAGRGKPVEKLGPTFTNLKDAEWEIFKRRWERYTGAPYE